MNLSEPERHAFATGYSEAVASRCAISIDDVETMINDGKRKADAATAAKQPAPLPDTMRAGGETR
jgi:hypothetical protein